VDSQNQLKLLLRTGKEAGRDYTTNLINSQVVPSYEETELPAVNEYREMITKYETMPPQALVQQAYEPDKYSFVSLEGFLNAKLMVEILKRLGPNPPPRSVKAVVEGIKNYDLGISVPVNFGPERHQGLDAVFLTTFEEGRFVTIGNGKTREK
jgi:hypothetical protein